MKKYLISGMAAIVFCGAFTSCSHDLDNGGDSTKSTVEETYEKAFITHFGEPASTQTWGFGLSAVAGTRAVVDPPSVTEVGNTFNAKMAALGYDTWNNTNWTDKFYQVNGSVVYSDLSDEYLTQVSNIILGQIPEGGNNLQKASGTGYSITTTKKGPVSLTPIYHFSNSGDQISYYYYPVGSNPTTDQIKAMKKYIVGNMADPEVCKGSEEDQRSFYRKTFSLVYEDESGNVSYDFPENYVINFIITNTWVYNGNVDVTSTALTQKGIFAIQKDASYDSGAEVSVDNCGKIKIGNTLNIPGFKQVQEGSTFTTDNGTTFKYYTQGNGVNGSLLGGATAYYLVPKSNGTMTVGIYLSGGKTVKVVKLSQRTDASGDEILSFTNPDSNNAYNGTISFDVNAWNTYAVYAEGSKLGFYGFEHDNGNGSVDNEAFTEWHINNVNLYYGLYFESSSTQVYMGKTPASFSAAKDNSEISGYTAYTNGAAANGGLTGGATTYYIQPSYTGIIRVAVSLAAKKALFIKDLGTDNWNATEGTDVTGFENGLKKSETDKYNGTIDFPAEANHIYAVYADDSRLGFYGCEFLAEESSSSSSVSVPNYPEFYGDGRMNKEIHSSGLTQWNLPDSKGYNITNPETPHVAVFSIGDRTFIGFEDWKDYDFNDVIFEVKGDVTGGEEIVIEDPIDDVAEIVVIAEDLTIDDARPDFDFNDVVFKVNWNKTQNTVTVDVLAAGGTLPLYIGGTSGTYTDGKEVHAAFAEMNPDKVITTGTMVNTYPGKHDQYKTPSFEITNFNHSATTIGEVASSIIVAVKKFGEFIELKAPKGGVPTKIAVKPDFLTDPNMGWCDERQDIDDKYNVNGTPLFKSYVKGELDDGWYREINPKKYQ